MSRLEKIILVAFLVASVVGALIYNQHAHGTPQIHNWSNYTRITAFIVFLIGFVPKLFEFRHHVAEEWEESYTDILKLFSVFAWLLVISYILA